MRRMILWIVIIQSVQVFDKAQEFRDIPPPPFFFLFYLRQHQEGHRPRKSIFQRKKKGRGRLSLTYSDLYFGNNKNEKMLVLCDFFIALATIGGRER